MSFKHTPEEARELVAQTLESGQFEQGVHLLCTIWAGEKYHCCLGVACEVFAKHEKLCIVERACQVLYDDKSGGLPEVVTNWLGFADNLGSYGETSLVKENDGGTSFTKISKLFRNPPEGLLI